MLFATPDPPHARNMDPEQPQPPVEETDNTQITLRVCSSDGVEIYFKIRRKTALKKLIGAYCTRLSKDPATVRFMYNGERLSGDATPDSLEMEENDVIDAMVEQTGGRAPKSGQPR